MQCRLWSAAKKVLQEEPQDLQFSFQLEAFERSHIEKYHAMFPGMVSSIPLTYFYLAAQRAHLAAMLDPNFPWPILGMVHVANRMEQRAEIREEQGFRLNVTIEIREGERGPENGSGGGCWVVCCWRGGGSGGLGFLKLQSGGGGHRLPPGRRGGTPPPTPRRHRNAPWAA